MPALLILDGLEVVCPAVPRGGDPGLVEPGGDALVAWLCDVLTALRAPSRPPVPGAAAWHELLEMARFHVVHACPTTSCTIMWFSASFSHVFAHLTAAVVVVATCNDVAELAEPLRAAGRLDAVILLPAPGPAQREAILAADLAARGLSLPQAELQVGSACLV